MTHSRSFTPRWLPNTTKIRFIEFMKFKEINYDYHLFSILANHLLYDPNINSFI